MLKDRSGVKAEPAQPLLKGMNLARFLCDKCPCEHSREVPDRRAGIVRACPPLFGPEENGVETLGPEMDQVGQPGRL